MALMSSHGDSLGARRLTRKEIPGGGPVFGGIPSGLSGIAYEKRAVCSKPASQARRRLKGPVLHPVAKFPSIRPKDGIVLRGGKASEPVTTRPIEPRYWELRSSSKPQLSKQTVQPIYTTPSTTEDERVSHDDRHHQGTEKGPARQRKSLVVILHLPRRKKSLIATLHLPKQISGRFDDCRTDIVAANTDVRKKRRRLCSDLTGNDAASKDNTAEVLYPSPISIQSTADKFTWTTRQSRVLRAEATIALPADEGSEKSPINQAVTQSTIDRDLTPWTLRPPVVPINIYESGHPLFVVTGNIWLDSMP
ncbi:MAG: hypothetical protein Q9199_007364 [Rusavskia elegans]